MTFSSRETSAALALLKANLTYQFLQTNRHLPYTRSYHHNP